LTVAGSEQKPYQDRPFLDPVGRIDIEIITQLNCNI